jgi:MFS family permease
MHMRVQQRLSPALPRVLALLVVAVLINYIDRSNLSIAAPLLKDEFRLSASQLGILLSSFFWTYTLFQIVSGWAVDRFDVNWVIAAGFLTWSLATAATALVHGFILLLMIRLILGIGESAAFPSCSKILARHCAERRRGLANALIMTGMMLGPALGTFAGGMLMARFGWRPFFLVLGLASLVWLLPWLKWMPREPHHRLLLSEMIEDLDHVGAKITRVEDTIEQHMRPFQEAVNRWLTVPGIKHRLAWTVVAEVGPTVQAFPSAADIVSWAGICPGNNQTAGKRKSGTTRAGNPWLRRALCEAAWAASKSKGTYLQAQFRRLVALRGSKRALIAVANSILTAGYYMLQRATTYQELGLLRQTQQGSSDPSPGQTPRSARAQGYPRTSFLRLSVKSEQ